MTWDNFHRLIIGKYFPASARHAKAREFLELRQGTMIVLEYVARFIESARFGDDYVAIDAAKLRKFEDGLTLSIWGKIIGHNLQDMDSMVNTTLIIEREVDDAHSIRDAGASNKKRGNKLLLQARERSRGLLFHEGFRGRAVANRAKARSGLPVRRGR